MKPIRTAETEREIVPHPDDKRDVGPLPAYRDPDGSICSIWEPTPEELQEVFGSPHRWPDRRFGIRLGVQAAQTPPIFVELVSLAETPTFVAGTPVRQAIGDLAKMGGIPIVEEGDTDAG